MLGCCQEVLPVKIWRFLFASPGNIYGKRGRSYLRNSQGARSRVCGKVGGLAALARYMCVIFLWLCFFSPHYYSSFLTFLCSLYGKEVVICFLPSKTEIKKKKSGTRFCLNIYIFSFRLSFSLMRSFNVK